MSSEGTFETECKIIDMYSHSARSFNQLSSAAIVLTVLFSEKVLGDQTSIDVTWTLVLTWILFLVSIFCGAFYQYFGVKFLENNFARGYVHIKLYPKFLVDSPGIIYGFMMATFIGGGATLIFTAIRGLVL